MTDSSTRWVCTLMLTLGAACGDDGPTEEPDAGDTCMLEPFEAGGEGAADPLAIPAGQARAGRIAGADLPPVESGLITWADGDFVLANEKIAVVIEDVGASDLYDPWGGRPVGFARVEDGALVEPADFGEFFLLTGRSTVMTRTVGVLSDGSDGEAAVVRVTGKLAPVPFFDAITYFVFRDGFEDVEAAIDYVLEPGAEHVEVYFHYLSPRSAAIELSTVMHGFMYTKRTPAFMPGVGFTDQIDDSEYIGLIDDDATSWAYFAPDEDLGAGVSASGFISGFTEGFTIPSCEATSRLHATLVVGGPGLDGLVTTVARDRGDTLRAITGVVENDDTTPAAGVRIHVETADGVYLTRASTGADGSYAVHVPPGVDVHLTAYRRGDVAETADVAGGAADATMDFTLAPAGAVHVTAVDGDDAPLPVRVQVLARDGQSVASVPGNYGERGLQSGRLHVEFPLTGDITLPVTAGTWEVVVSRGYEYELVREDVEVVAGETAEVAATLERVVDTDDIQCGDFHIHTVRSNDADDDGLRKVASAIADGVELPVRSDHEYVADFTEEIAALEMEDWAIGFGSIELTSMEIWGHMGVFPLVPDASAVNGGAPLWQEFPTAESPDTALRTLSPKVVFDQVRARPEEPVVIINHPRGNTNYFGYVGYDPATGMVDLESDWDTTFTLVEVFNDSGWLANRNGTVRDWLSFNTAGRKVFAVGSSDSHGIDGSPVGYPRTCISVGTDVPGELDAELVRDQLAAGHATVSGGIHPTVDVDGSGPGDTVDGAAETTMVDVQVQAASWIDVDFLEVVVDGAVVDTIGILPEDADPENPTIRFHQQVPVDVSASGSYVVIAAYGDATLEPVHPGRVPFAVTNPIYLEP